VILLAKAWSASARASSLEARRRKRAAKLASLEKVSKVNYDECKPLPQETFANDSANLKLLEESQEVWNSFSGKEKKAVRDYTSESNNRINPLLIAHAQGKAELSSDQKEFSEIKVLDKLVTSNILKKGMVLFRGVKPSEMKAMGLDSVQVGMEIRDPKFLSTTHDAGIARTFSEATGEQGVILEIRAPEGTKGLPVDTASLRYDYKVASKDKRTNNGGEREVILPRDRIMKVSRIYKKQIEGWGPERTVIQVDLINYDQDPKPFI